jgi:hypothetical protein
VQRERDAVVGVDRAVDVAGQRGEHRPGEGVARRLLAVQREDAHVDADRLGGQLEGALEVGPGQRLGEEHGAGLVDGDAEVLDVVDREVQPGGQAGGGRAQDRQVGPGGGQSQHDHVPPGP